MEVVEGRDPLLVLPAEVLHMVCSLLPAGDLARLSELSTGWREFARDESLWRGAGLRLRNTEVPLPPNHLRVLLRAPCLGVLDISDVQSVRYAKRLEEALRKLSKVRRLRWSCLTEAEVILPLLQRLAPHLEEMEVTELTETLEILDAVTLPAVRKVVINSHFDFIYPMDWEQAANQPSYLGVLEAMPALKSLRIHVDPGVMPTTPYLNFGLPPHLEELSLSAVSQEQLESILRMSALRTLRLDHDGSARVTARCEGPPAGHRGLRLLAVRIDQLHPDADACMLSLVRAHAAGLRELLIRNDDPDTRDRNKERFLVDKLRAYPFRELQKLTLERVWSHECGVECKAQIEELTHNLRHCGAKVCCTKPSFDTSDSSSEEDESD